ncbi:unnamed protein product [Rotaria sp. Silwood1]|nr:unnamed protein product [Rotaria sp. Silwood1]
MAKIYETLQKLLISYEDWPKAIITEQTFIDSVFIIRGKNRGRPAWHYLLVPVNKVTDLKAQKSGANIDITKFGRLIEYLNNRDKVITLSGWGTDPPGIIQTWISEHYNSSPAVDESINLTYTNDDIRLCTMQRAIPKQILGFFRHYFSQQPFHYIKLMEDLPSSLARRAGLKNYDRVIFLNGINIENDTYDQLWYRFDTERHLPVQMFVCSPATYEYYKTNKKAFHFDLPTIQCLKPVYATSTSESHTDVPVVSVDNKSFCAVQWENSNIISAVPQSAIFKSPEFTELNDICFIETEGQYRRGQIIFKGSRNDCDKLKTASVSPDIGDTPSILTDLFIRPTSNVLDSTTSPSPDPEFTDDKSARSLDTTIKLSSQKSSQKMATYTVQAQIAIQDRDDDTKMMQNIDGVQYIQNRVCTTFEKFPNELFYYLFTFIDIQHLYKAFWGLNSRLNNIFQSCQNLSLTFDNKIDLESMKLYAPYVNRLIIQTSIFCDFNQFPNLHTLVLCNTDLNHMTQIQSEIIPNLTYLSFLLGTEFNVPHQLVCDVFSNKFSSLRYVNLCRIDESTRHSWSTSSSLQFVSILSCQPISIPAILASCPNLHHLQVHVLHNNDDLVTSFSPSNHSLRRLTLWSDSTELTFNDIDNILTYTPNIEYLYLQTIYSMSFIDLAHSLINRLHYLSQFDCYIKEMLPKDDRIETLTTVRQIHSCFNRIQFIEENDEFRTITTK